MAEADALRGRAIRTLRAQRLAAADVPTVPVALGESAGATEPEPEADRGRVRLTKGQQMILVRLLAVNDDLRELRETLAEQYPEINLLSDRALRWWRARVEAGEFPIEVEAARALVERHGLALRSVRIEALRQQYRQLGRLEAKTIDSATLLAIAREKRAVLADLRAETGQVPGSPARPGAPAGAIGEAVEPVELLVFLQELASQQQQQADALAGAQRPESEELE